MSSRILLMSAIAMMNASAVAGATSLAFALVNPSFEDIKDGLPVGWSHVGRGMRAERGVGHNGSGGIVWESKTPSAGQSACVQDVKVDAGRPYVFSCLVRTENFKTTRGGACICMEWYDAQGKWMSGGYTHGFNEPNCDWTLLQSVTREIPAGAKTVKVQVYVQKGATGKVCFDNVSVAPFDRAPVPFVFSSAYRGLAVSGPVRFHAALFPPANAKPDDLVVTFAYVAADGRTVRAPGVFEYSEKGVPDGASIALDVAQLKMGEQSVTCTLSEKIGGKSIGSASCPFSRVSKLPERRVWIDEHQRCIVDGKPFFPLGMYWGAVEEKKLEKYCQGPFNCLMPYSRVTPAQLDLCHKKGLKAFSNLKNETLHSAWARARKITTQDQVDAFFIEEINRVKDHPALLGWYVNDESPVSEVPERTHLYGIFCRMDPNHPTWAVLDRLYDLREFIPTYDVLGMDPYPVAQKPMTHITEFVRGTQKAIFGDRPLWNVPQAFNWGWYRKDDAAKERFPTEAELKSMNWQHIACGANGLVSYCFHAYWRDVKPEEFDKYFGPVCRAAEEVKRMMPVLLSVDKAPTVSGAPVTVPTRTWMHGGDLYVLAANARDWPAFVDLGISEGAWEVVGSEIGPAARMTAPNRLAVDLPALGNVIVRLRPQVRKSVPAAALAEPLAWLYPDSKVSDVVTPAEVTDVPANGVAEMNVLFNGLDVSAPLTFSDEGAGAEFFRLVAAPVELNTGKDGMVARVAGSNPHVTRQAPFRVYDAMEPLKGGSIRPTESTQALRVRLRRFPTEKGEFTVKLAFAQDAAKWTFDFRVKVHPAKVVPVGKASFKYTNWMNFNSMASCHGLKAWSEEHWEMIDRYLALAAYGRQNMVMIPCGDVRRMERFVKLLDKNGIWWIEGSHLARFSTWHWGAPAFVPHGSTNLTTSAAGAADLAKSAADLAKVIDAHGWRARWYQHVADEPSYHNVTNYRITCGIVRKAMPGIRLTDAVESFDMGGALDAYCPKSYVYEREKSDYDLLKSSPTDEMWCYTCCFPGGPWTNRLLDNELLRPVYLPWGCACFKLDGYLHWGFNQYGADSNPFRQSCGMDMHLGSLLPPGDRNIAYPGKDGPWPSVRLEAMRQGFEDLELLKALSARDATAAERIRKLVVRGFGDYTADPKAYRAARRALLEAQ